MKVKFPPSVPTRYRMQLGLLISRFFKKDFLVEEFVPRAHNRDVPVVSVNYVDGTLWFGLDVDGVVKYYGCRREEDNGSDL